LAGSDTAGFSDPFRYLAGLLWKSTNLDLHTTTRHRKTRTITYAFSGIETHDISVQMMKS
jgi:hypothetical protein